MPPQRKCEHRHHKSERKQCGGSQICEHNHVQGVPGPAPTRHQEPMQGVRQFCPHQREKRRCRECGGSQICEHNHRRSRCKECPGADLCPHKSIKSQCRECGGSQICRHNLSRNRCKECTGADLSPHKRRKSFCRCSPVRTDTSCASNHPRRARQTNSSGGGGAATAGSGSGISNAMEDRQSSSGAQARPRMPGKMLLEETVLCCHRWPRVVQLVFRLTAARALNEHPKRAPVHVHRTYTYGPYRPNSRCCFISAVE